MRSRVVIVTALLVLVGCGSTGNGANPSPSPSPNSPSSTATPVVNWAGKEFQGYFVVNGGEGSDTFTFDSLAKLGITAKIDGTVPGRMDGKDYTLVIVETYNPDETVPQE